MLKCYVCGKKISIKQQMAMQFYYVGEKNGEKFYRHKKCANRIIRKYRKTKEKI